MAGVRIALRGTVQGVGFRPWVHRLAAWHGLTGRVWNDTSGVVIEAFGSAATLEAFTTALRGAPATGGDAGPAPPPAARIDDVRCESLEATPPPDFAIVHSAAGAERRVSIPADLATCAECARELHDPADRRHGYPFTNCTHCGPRYTIALDVPYDRPVTTMAPFAMCPECQREYDSPADRRFHAQPNACPACGPRLRAVDEHGRDVPGSGPLASAAAALRAGRIVAVKGLGGFHLAVDATDEAAVSRLRKRKHRDEKPFAVMVASLRQAEELADLDAAERELLGAVERPIVLLHAREDVPLAPSVAPGNPLVGVLLAYTPLHLLLLAAVGRPLVMTSANLSDEPLAYRNAEALERLRGIADLWLIHDRDIASRCDDSVARVIAGAPTVLRRARGYVPRGVPLARPVARPVLACGAHLKNAFCLAAGDTAYLGPHVGDLETEAACAHLEESIERLQRFLGIRPEIVAHDLHPDYFSTRYALARPEATKVAVQHHHAHVAATMAEHGIEGPALGVAYDGTGHGTDGTSWGGELLLVQDGTFERVATFRGFPLAGGDRAVREVWRQALALLDEAFEGDPPLDALELFRRVPASRVRSVRRMIATGLNAPLARGVGRYFDAFGALGLARPQASYEGQVALEWNLAACRGNERPYPWVVAHDLRPWELDLRPTLRRATQDLLNGVSLGSISARFHETLVALTADLVRKALAEHGPLPVVATGGCFQNPWLAGGLRDRLAPDVSLLLHREVPPGDGGIALGQVVVADAVARKSL